jgi:hypothetical protein
VYADAGRHEIRFYYRQRGLRAGLALSILGLIGLIVAFTLAKDGPQGSRSSPS